MKKIKIIIIIIGIIMMVFIGVSYAGNAEIPSGDPGVDEITGNEIRIYNWIFWDIRFIATLLTIGLMNEFYRNSVVHKKFYGKSEKEVFEYLKKQKVWGIIKILWSVITILFIYFIFSLLGFFIFELIINEEILITLLLFYYIIAVILIKADKKYKNLYWYSVLGEALFILGIISSINEWSYVLLIILILPAHLSTKIQGVLYRIGVIEEKLREFEKEKIAEEEIKPENE